MNWTSEQLEDAQAALVENEKISGPASFKEMVDLLESRFDWIGYAEGAALNLALAAILMSFKLAEPEMEDGAFKTVPDAILHAAQKACDLEEKIEEREELLDKFTGLFEGCETDDEGNYLVSEDDADELVNDQKAIEMFG